MFVIHRTRTGTDSCPEELVDIAGTTGNVYQVHIKQVPSCSCPHAQKGNQCKHIIYVRIFPLQKPNNVNLTYIRCRFLSVCSKLEKNSNTS